MRTIKTQIVFPEDVLEELDQTVKNRERSDFVVQAVQEKLKKIRLEKVLPRASGLWRDREDMRTDRQVQSYVKRMRGADTRRFQRIQKAFRDG